MHLCTLSLPLLVFLMRFQVCVIICICCKLGVHVCISDACLHGGRLYRLDMIYQLVLEIFAEVTGVNKEYHVS